MSSQKRPTSRNATKRKRKASTDVRSTERIMGRKDDGDVERSEEEIEEEREENIRRKEVRGGSGITYMHDTCMIHA